MPRLKLLDQISRAITGKLSPDTVRSRIEAAEVDVSEAERDYRVSAAATEAGGDPADEAAAEQRLDQARRALARLRAVLQEVEAQDAENARIAQAAQDAAEDAEVAKDCAAWAKAAQAVAPAAASYATAYRGLVEAGDRLRNVALTNPRVRHDLLLQNADALVSLELARICAGVAPPGADRWAVASRDPREIAPIADHAEAVVAAIREGLTNV